MRFVRLALSRVRRCHWFTWCVVLVVGAAMVLIVVPADKVMDTCNCYREPWAKWAARQCDPVASEVENKHFADKDGNESCCPMLYKHGWPQPCLVRGFVPSGDYDPFDDGSSKALIRYVSSEYPFGGPIYGFVSWSNYDNWPIVSDASRWHLGYLLLDAVVALAIVGFSGACTEWWLRSRGGIFRFRIIDLLAVTTVFALILGWHQSHLRVQRLEDQFVGRVNNKPRDVDDKYDNDPWAVGRYFGPDWLRRLVGGDEDLLPFFYHVYDVSLPLDDQWREDLEQLARLPYVESVTFSEGMPWDALRQLEKLPRLHTLDIFLRRSFSPKISGNPGNQPIGATDLGELRRLNLEELFLEGEDVLAKDVEVVTSFPTLKKLTLWEVLITPEELEAIRSRHPQLMISAAWFSSDVGDMQENPPPGHAKAVEQAKLRRQKGERIGPEGAEPLEVRGAEPLGVEFGQGLAESPPDNRPQTKRAGNAEK